MTRRNLLQGLFLAVGVAVLFYTMRSMDLSALGEEARHGSLTWASLLVVFLYPFMTLCDVRGWQIVLPAQAKGARAFRELFWIRMAGEAFNGITPFADIGGEWLKTVLTASRLRITERAAFASVILTRTGMFYAELAYWSCGFALVGTSGVWAEWRPFFFVVAAVFAVIAAAVALLQKNGLLQFFLAPFKALGVGGEKAERAHVSARELDAEISVFYHAKIWVFFRSIVWHFLGWVAGGVETWVMFYAVGAPVSLGEGLAIEALFQLLKTGSFFIPGNLGVQEAGFGYFAQAAGFPPALGLAVSFLKRIRQWLWTGVGFGIWIALGRVKTEAAEAGA